MKIYIPTIGRRNDQKTAETLTEARVDFKLVIPEGESQFVDYECLHCPEKGIRATRQWILERVKGKLVMMDDDLDFFTRDLDGNTFHRAKNSEIRAMLLKIEGLLDTYSHGGIQGKFMSQRQPRDVKFNSKYLQVLCYNKNLFPIPPPRFELEVAENEEMNLKLLTRGCPNFVLTEWTIDNKPYAPGGCNVWRTNELEFRETVKLSKLFPDLVRVVQTDPDKIKADWKKAPKLNLHTRINWKKAIEQGLKDYPRRFPR